MASISIDNNVWMIEKEKRNFNLYITFSHKHNGVKRSCCLSSGIKWRHAPPSRFHASQTSAICEHNLRANCDFMARQLRLLLPRSTRYTIVPDF